MHLAAAAEVARAGIAEDLIACVCERKRERSREGKEEVLKGSSDAKFEVAQLSPSLFRFFFAPNKLGLFLLLFFSRCARSPRRYEPQLDLAARLS